MKQKLLLKFSKERWIKKKKKLFCIFNEWGQEIPIVVSITICVRVDKGQVFLSYNRMCRVYWCGIFTESTSLYQSTVI